jgi:hypothetical protein
MTTLALDSAHAYETSHRAPAAGAVAGLPRLLLRAEGAAALAAGVYAYAQLGAGWGMFAALFLVPDLSMLGYLAGARIGAHSYNVAHSYLTPAVLAIAGLVSPALLPWAALWLAHIGFDRALGYGLKYTTAFGDTHLGRVGSRA